MEPKGPAAYISEFVGTFFLVLGICGVTELKEPPVYVLAVSDFLRSLFLILVATPFILLWGCALLDLIRGNHSGWAIVGWMVVILVIPIIGPMIYFALRKPTRNEVDEKYLADRELQRAAAARPVGGPGLGPY